jgi:hypothetical protein
MDATKNTNRRNEDSMGITIEDLIGVGLAEHKPVEDFVPGDTVIQAYGGKDTVVEPAQPADEGFVKIRLRYEDGTTRWRRLAIGRRLAFRII